MMLIKLVHMSCAGGSILGFVTRGVLMMRDSPLLASHWLKSVPHLIDTTLLMTAIIMAMRLGLSPANSSWILAKVIALLFYIGLGMVALRFGRTKEIRITAWFAALMVVVYIVAVAVTKSPFIGL